jgi:hypothetical protein
MAIQPIGAQNVSLGRRARGNSKEGEETRSIDQAEGKMSDQDKQFWPAAKIQRRLRADEALIELVRAQRVFDASRKQPDIPVRSEAIRRLTLLGAGKAPKTKAGRP